MPEDLAPSPSTRGARAGAPPPPVPPPTGWVAPPSRRRAPGWVAWTAGIAAGLVVVVLVAAAFVRVPYVIVTPGDATPLDDSVLQVEGVPTYAHDGQLLFLTVSVSTRDPNVYRYLFARLDPDARVERREQVIGCQSFDASQRLARDQMAQSQDVAKTVALRRLGFDVPEELVRAQVLDVVCGGPADGRLEPGDVIVALDGVPVTTAEEVRPLVQVRQPGDVAVFSVERDGARRDVRVRLGERDGVAYAGILTQTDRRHRIPVDVRIDTARVSGPSAGLAFSLAIIDDLTPGDLTGGGDVAVTGAILEDGTVGRVGGVAEKAVAARRAGARLMLVPRGEVAAARSRAGDMKVVGVATLDDALRALARAGGSSIAAPPATAQ